MNTFGSILYMPLRKHVYYTCTHVHMNINLRTMHSITKRTAFLLNVKPEQLIKRSLFQVLLSNPRVDCVLVDVASLPPSCLFLVAQIQSSVMEVVFIVTLVRIKKTGKYTCVAFCTVNI